MEAISNLLQRAQSQALQTGRENTKTTTDLETRRRTLAKILFDDRISRQFDPRSPEETDVIVNAMLPQARSIPTEHLYPCYVLAIEMREPGNSFPISCNELVQAWKVRQGSLEMESLDKSRLLPENAASACERCTKVGGQYLEVMPDGAVGGPCDHRPLTDEERAENTRIGLEMLERARREAEKVREAKLQAEREAEGKPRFFNVKMKCDSCGRVVDNPMGQCWAEGGPCGKLINTGDESYAIPQLCEGRLYAISRMNTKSQRP